MADRREWDDSVQVTLEAYREMVAQRDRFRDQAQNLKSYKEAWMRLPVACRSGMCCTQDSETRAEHGCGVESCTIPDCPA